MEHYIGVIELGIKGVRYIIAGIKDHEVFYLSSQGTLVNFDTGFDNVFCSAGVKDISKTCETINSYIQNMMESGCHKIILAYKNSLRHLVNFPQVVESIKNTEYYSLLYSTGKIENKLLDKEEEGRILCETAYRTTLRDYCRPGDRIIVFDHSTGDTTFSSAICTEEYDLRHDKSIQNWNLSGKRLEQEILSLRTSEYSDIEDIEKNINDEVRKIELPPDGNNIFLVGTNNSIGNVLWQKERLSGRYHPAKVDGLQLETNEIIRPVYLALAYRLQQGHSQKEIFNDLGLRNPSNVISVLAISYALGQETSTTAITFCAYGLRHGLAHRELE